MALDDIYRITLDSTLHGQRVLNTFHYRLNDPVTGNFSDSLALAWQAEIVGPLLALVSNEFTALGVICQRIRPLPVLAAYTEALVSASGLVEAPSLPSSVAVVVSKYTELAGSANRGRNYFAGLTDTHEDESQLAVAWRAGWQSFADLLSDIIVDGAAHNFVPCVFHRSTGLFTDIVNCVVRGPLRNQRRRQVGRGE